MVELLPSKQVVARSSRVARSNRSKCARSITRSGGMPLRVPGHSRCALPAFRPVTRSLSVVLAKMVPGQRPGVLVQVLCRSSQRFPAARAHPRVPPLQLWGSGCAVMRQENGSLDALWPGRVPWRLTPLPALTVLEFSRRGPPARLGGEDQGSANPRSSSDAGRQLLRVVSAGDEQTPDRHLCGVHRRCY